MKWGAFVTAIFLMGSKSFSQDGQGIYNLDRSYRFGWQDAVIAFADANRNGIQEAYVPRYSTNPDSSGVVIYEFNGLNLVRQGFIHGFFIPWYAEDIDQDGLVEIVGQSGDESIGGNGYLQVWKQNDSTSLEFHKDIEIALYAKKVYYFAQSGLGPGRILMSPNSFEGGGLRVYKINTLTHTLDLEWDWVSSWPIDAKAVGDFDGDGRIEIMVTDMYWLNPGERDAQLSASLESNTFPGVMKPPKPIEKQFADQCMVRVFEQDTDSTFTFHETWIWSGNVELSAVGPTRALDYNGDGVKEFVGTYSVLTADTVDTLIVYAGYFGSVFENAGDDNYRLVQTIGEFTGHFGAIHGIAANFDDDPMDEFFMTVYPSYRMYGWDETLNTFTYTDVTDMLVWEAYAVPEPGHDYPELMLLYVTPPSTQYLAFYSYQGPATSVYGIVNTVPERMMLYQNYPNPFNPTTTIRFSLPKEGYVRLTVFDVLGREVARLVNGGMQSGSHMVTLNASNLASGIYFYRLMVGGEISSTREMFLVK